MTEFLETANSTAERLEIVDVVAASPESIWAAFTDAEGLTSWWPEEATTEAIVGGKIIAVWPSMGWTMRGRYTELEPDRVVAFTWSWDHEPDTPERTVRVTLEPLAAGTSLTLSHGDYSLTDRDERAGHLEGWKHFLPRLDNDASI